MIDFLLNNLLFVLSLIAILAFSLVIYVFVRNISGKSKLSKKDCKFIQSNWEGILKEAESNPKLAIMEADKLLDHVLGKIGKQGNLGDKLKKSEALFSDLNGVWSAHKLRNNIAHQVSFEPSNKQVRNALKSFSRAISDLGVKVRS